MNLITEQILNLTIEQETILIGSVLAIIFILLIIYIIYLQNQISKVTQQKEIASKQMPVQQDILREAERITEELAKMGLSGQDIAQVGFQITMYGQFIYTARGMEELERKGKKKG